MTESTDSAILPYDATHYITALGDCLALLHPILGEIPDDFKIEVTA